MNTALYNGINQTDEVHLVDVPGNQISYCQHVMFLQWLCFCLSLFVSK